MVHSRSGIDTPVHYGRVAGVKNRLAGRNSGEGMAAMGGLSPFQGSDSDWFGLVTQGCASLRPGLKAVAPSGLRIDEPLGIRRIRKRVYYCDRGESSGIFEFR